jgi:membrane-bound lytic murein transglycosylase F
LKIVNEFLERERSAARIPTLEVATLTPQNKLPRANARQLGIDVEYILPELRPVFETAAAETGIDWLLLAAIAYQESMWKADAISPNGAQGIMMLMPRTARSLGVVDPFDPAENILAGSRYLARLRATLPERIPEPDRTWMAIASYNMGYGHLEDARVLTARQGGDPDSWADVRERLTLLSEEFWYLQVKNGYARGLETKRMLDRVQQYLALLREEFSS